MTQTIKKVGQYRLTHRIGSGATSQVFQAVKQGDHQKYAVKMIRLNKITQNQKQMISKQISIIKSISHPNIVKLYDNLQTSNNFYLVFQFCQKGDLEKYLKQYYGPLIPEDAVQKIFFCIGDAVREIHSKDIVHRDIKLANILLKRDLVIKLADFGFAKQINQEQFMLKTYCGTPITMAPEILQNKYYDRKCDIWSLGVIMFQLVYGKLPFSITEGYNKFVQRVIKEPLKIPAQPQMPQQFKDLLNKCLEKNPEKRCCIQQFMDSEWILQGKNKKLQQRKRQSQDQVSQLLRNISSQSFQDQNQLKERQRNQIIQMNTAEKLYKLLKNQLQKIFQNHNDNREQIYDKIQKAKSSNEVSQQSKTQYLKIEKLLYFLDYKYLMFLKDLKVTVIKDSSQVAINIEDIKYLQQCSFLYVSKGSSQQTETPSYMAFGQTIQDFLRKLGGSQNPPDSLQRRKQRYQLIDKLFSMLKRFQLTVDILFAHHYHRQQISMQNVLSQFKQMGKHISQSTIQQPSQMDENSQQGSSQAQQKSLKFDKLSNFITLSIECKQRNQKAKQLRQSLKQTGQRMVDQISKTIQGYYN